MAYPTTLDSFATLIDNVDDVLASHPNDRATAIEAIESKLGIDSSAVATSIDYLLKNANSEDPGHTHSLLTNFIASGRSVYLYENTAPTGWTIVAVTDSVLAVKGGSQAYNVTGGQVVGSWQQPDHSLTIAELAAHTHQIGSHDSTAGDSSTVGKQEFVADYGYAGSGYGPAATTSSTGSGSAHNHGTTYRPRAAVGIIISKD